MDNCTASPRAAIAEPVDFPELPELTNFTELTGQGKHELTDKFKPMEKEIPAPRPPSFRY